jgi:hypothetical protein
MDIDLSVIARKHCIIGWAVGECRAGLALLDSTGMDALAAAGRPTGPVARRETSDNQRSEPAAGRSLGTVRKSAGSGVITDG